MKAATAGGVLVVLSSSYALVVEHIRRKSGALPFHGPSVILYAEGLKALSMGILVLSFSRDDLRLLRSVPPRTLASSLIPGVFYTLQNNLNMFVLQHIDATTFQLLSTLKLITTGVLSRLFLNRSLTPVRWASLCILGISVINSTACGAPSNPSAQTGTNEMFLVGCIICILNQVVASFALVWNELFLKQSNDSGLELSFFAKNGLLYLSGVLCSLPFWKPSTLSTFGYVSWGVSVYLAVVGMSVATVLRLTDSNNKNALGVASLFLTSTIGFVEAHTVPSTAFICSLFNIVVAFFLYYDTHPTHAWSQIAVYSKSEVQKLDP